MFVVLGVFVFSGPFGTFAEMNLLERVIYWTPQAVLAWIIAAFSCELAWYFYPTEKRHVHGLLSALCFAFLYAPLDYLITQSAIFGHLDIQMPFWQVLMSNLAFALILVIWVLLAEGTHSAPNNAVRARLYSRLPKDAIGEIMHITVKDHYVEIWTAGEQKHRLLMRFADAVQEMDGTPGYCTHRSHWVSSVHVKNGKRVGNKEFVEMACGKEVPVSKTYRENLVAAGFLEVAQR